MIPVITFGTRSRSRPRSSSGTVVVEASTTDAATPSVPLTTMFHAPQSPATESDTPSTSTRSPCPMNGRNTANSEERQLEDHPPGQRHEAQASGDGDRGHEDAVDGEGPERRARRRHDRQHEHDEPDDLGLRRQRVHPAVPVVVEPVAGAVPAAHGELPGPSRPATAGAGPGATPPRRRHAFMPKKSAEPIANVTATPMTPARPFEIRAFVTPCVE